jgi:hypothetical protein
MTGIRRPWLPLLLVIAFAPGAHAATRSLSSIVTADAFLPAVNIVGATGVYRTDITIFNPQQNNVAVKLFFTPADTDGTGLGGLNIVNGLDARESVTLVDVVGAYFNLPGSYGILNVQGLSAAGGSELIVTSNTYNVAGAVAGTYGQFSPGQPIEDALGFDDSDAGDLYLPGLPYDADHRVNAVVINPTGVSPLEVGVQLVDAFGNIIGKNVYDVPPYSMHQINDIYSAFPTPQPENAPPYRLNVFVNLANGAKVLCYATVTDKRTGDPYLITGLAQIH